MYSIYILHIVYILYIQMYYVLCTQHIYIVYLVLVLLFVFLVRPKHGRPNHGSYPPISLAGNERADSSLRGCQGVEKKSIGRALRRHFLLCTPLPSSKLVPPISRLATSMAVEDKRAQHEMCGNTHLCYMWL